MYLFGIKDEDDINSDGNGVSQPSRRRTRSASRNETPPLPPAAKRQKPEDTPPAPLAVRDGRATRSSTKGQASVAPASTAVISSIVRSIPVARPQPVARSTGRRGHSTAVEESSRRWPRSPSPPDETALRMAASSSGGALGTRRRSGALQTDAAPLHAQKTPLEAIESFVANVGVPNSSLVELLGKQVRKKSSTPVPLSAIDGCIPTDKITLLDYVACLCHAHAECLVTFADANETRREQLLCQRPVSDELHSNCEGAMTVDVPDEVDPGPTELAAPTKQQWSDAIMSCSREPRSRPPMLTSLSDVCTLVHHLIPGANSMDNDSMVRASLVHELYEQSEPMVMQAFLNFCRAMCRAVSSVSASAGGRLADDDPGCAVLIATCFETVIKTVKDLVTFELSLVPDILDTTPVPSLCQKPANGTFTKLDIMFRKRMYRNLALWLMSCPQVPDGNAEFCDKRDSLHMYTIVDTCFQYMSRKNQKVRNVLVELIQTIVTETRSRSSCVFQWWNILGNRVASEIAICVSVMSRSTYFWSNVMQTVAKKIRKLPKAFAFVGALLYHKDFALNFIQSENTKVRHMVLQELIVHFFNETFARDPASALRATALPSGAESSDLSIVPVLSALLKQAVIQREIIGGGFLDVKEAFLSAMDSLLTSAVQHVPNIATSNNAEKLAEMTILGGPESPADSCEAATDESNEICKNSGTDDVQRNKVIRLRVLAFTASLFGLCVKSFQDGSWDPDHFCTLKAMVSGPRLQAKRALGSLYLRLVNLQRALEQDVAVTTSADGHVDLMVLLSIDDSNRFMLALDYVRRRFVGMIRDRSSSLPMDGEAVAMLALEEKKPARKSSVGGGRTEVPVVMPDITQVQELRQVVTSDPGWLDFDEQIGPIQLLQLHVMAAGVELLSRYDPGFAEPAKWKKTGFRNKYGKFARGLLPKKVLPIVCSCIPAAIGRVGNIGQDSQFACSNDLCENRNMMVECDPRTCPAKETCQNRRMQKLQYSKIEQVSGDAKGQGIVAAQDIDDGALIGEYQGEVIDAVEFQKRKARYRGERHFYFMELTSKLYIDASRQAQITRFINHSCNPNAATQKWNADGEPRIGIFAHRKILAGEEVTFDYGTRFVGDEEDPVKCLCGSLKCRGFLMAKREPAFRIDEHEDDEDTGECDAEVMDDDSAGEDAIDIMDAKDAKEAKCAKDLREAKILKGKRLRADALQLAAKALKAGALDDAVCIGINANLDTKGTTNERRLMNWEASVKEMSLIYRAHELDAGRIPKKSSSSVDVNAEQGTQLMPDMHARCPKQSPASHPSASMTIPRKSPEAIAIAALKLQHNQQSQPIRISKPGGLDQSNSISLYARKVQSDGNSGKFRSVGPATFMPVEREADRNGGGHMAPVVRNRSRNERRGIVIVGEDSDSSDDWSTASAIVPAADDAIFVPEFDIDREANSDDEFVEAPPVPGFADDDECDGNDGNAMPTPDFGVNPRDGNVPSPSYLPVQQQYQVPPAASLRPAWKSAPMLITDPYSSALDACAADSAVPSGIDGLAPRLHHQVDPRSVSKILPPHSYENRIATDPCVTIAPVRHLPPLQREPLKNPYPPVAAEHLGNFHRLRPKVDEHTRRGHLSDSDANANGRTTSKHPSQTLVQGPTIYSRYQQPTNTTSKYDRSTFGPDLNRNSRARVAPSYEAKPGNVSASASLAPHCVSHPIHAVPASNLNSPSVAAHPHPQSPFIASVEPRSTPRAADASLTAQQQRHPHPQDVHFADASLTRPPPSQRLTSFSPQPSGDLAHLGQAPRRGYLPLQDRLGHESNHHHSHRHEEHRPDSHEQFYRPPLPAHRKSYSPNSRHEHPRESSRLEKSPEFMFGYRDAGRLADSGNEEALAASQPSDKGADTRQVKPNAHQTRQSPYLAKNELRERALCQESGPLSVSRRAAVRSASPPRKLLDLRTPLARQGSWKHSVERQQSSPSRKPAINQQRRIYVAKYEQASLSRDREEREGSLKSKADHEQSPLSRERVVRKGSYKRRAESHQSVLVREPIERRGSWKCGPSIHQSTSSWELEGKQESWEREPEQRQSPRSSKPVENQELSKRAAVLNPSAPSSEPTERRELWKHGLKYDKTPLLRQISSNQASWKRVAERQVHQLSKEQLVTQRLSKSETEPPQIPHSEEALETHPWPKRARTNQESPEEQRQRFRGGPKDTLDASEAAVAQSDPVAPPQKDLRLKLLEKRRSASNDSRHQYDGYGKSKGGTSRFRKRGSNKSFL
jgi:SET domain/AWS domain